MILFRWSLVRLPSGGLQWQVGRADALRSGPHHMQPLTAAARPKIVGAGAVPVLLDAMGHSKATLLLLSHCACAMGNLAHHGERIPHGNHMLKPDILSQRSLCPGGDVPGAGSSLGG